MTSFCGANCEECPKRENCAGCETLCGNRRGRCVAADYIRVGGIPAYSAFKKALLAEINRLLAAEGLPVADALYELLGEDVNLAYPLPDGRRVTFLSNEKIYLGTQIALPDPGVCVGAVADASFILLCRYGVDGADPEILLYKQR